VSFMASKTNTTPRKEEVPNKEGPETPPDSPMLDLSGAAVKKLIGNAKQSLYLIVSEWHPLFAGLVQQFNGLRWICRTESTAPGGIEN